MRMLKFALAGLLLLGAAEAREYPYELRYEMTLQPERGLAQMQMTLGDGARHVKEMRLHIDPDRQREFAGDSEFSIDGEYLHWSPPEEGGTLSWEVLIDDQRNGGAYDARMTDSWAVFRGDDLVPPARIRIRKGAEAEASLKVNLPEDWSFRAPYRRIGNNLYQIQTDHRSFDRPVGWMVAGDIGVRLERIDGIYVAVAGPTGQDVRRMDILAFLNWNLPWVNRVFPDMPQRLLVVSAGADMWRGGLSGPRSIYLHASRPLISGNGTSTLLHELIHTATGLRGEEGADWIVEGLAEFYSLEIMRRSGTITEARFDRAMEHLEEWGRESEDLTLRQSSGATTALAVGVMRAVDQEIRRRSGDDASLDEVARQLADGGKVSLSAFRKAAEAAAGDPVEALRAGNLPGTSD